MNHLRVYLGVSCYFLDIALLVNASCDLTGNAWPVPAWKDIIRKTSVSTCDATTIGNGQCDNTNNMAADSCQYDGGDCCMSTCVKNCVLKQQSLPSLYGGDLVYTNLLLKKYECIALCGVVPSPATNCPYQCLDDDYMGKGAGYTAWCNHNRGVQTAMSDCFATYDDIVRVMRECVIDDRSHGNGATASPRCGNQTMDCALSDVSSQIDGCHIHPDLCTQGNCCDVAIANGWISLAVQSLPEKCDLLALCDADCFATMAQCVRGNKACKGGCCDCTENGWFGPNCEEPLCWPKCRQGKCVAPNTCFCNSGWSGESCEIPVCLPNCVGGQGLCVSPNVCDCFYGFEGNQCQLAKSTPPCINGAAVAPDVCRCDVGWGGRICDYPLCQSYPVPSSDCDHGICESPWTCKCEPGWSPLIPLGPDGLVILPEFWNGRDTSLLVPANQFVFGDTRFIQTGVSSYTFEQYSAFKCSNADCRLVVDAHCSSCVENVCSTCDGGFYLDADGRCSKCQLKFTHCRQCTFDVCTACDPLFVLVGNECSSDGIIEFSSAQYHVSSNSSFVEIDIIRTVDSVSFDFEQRDQLVANPLQFVVHAVPSDSGGAVFSSSDAFADFESTRVVVSWGAISSSLVEPEDRPTARSLLVLTQTVQLDIFDNLRYDPGLWYFKVILLADPETVSGSTFPIRPEPGSQTTYAGRVEDDPIAQANVYIWDSSSFDYTTCEVNPSFIADASAFTVGPSTFQVPVRCSKCLADEPDLSGCATWGNWDASDDIVLVTSVFGAGVLPSLATTSLGAGSFDVNGYLNISASLPGIEGIGFSVEIQSVYSGVMVAQYIFESAPLPGQAPDIQRREHSLNRTWTLGQDAPAYSEYTGFVAFTCFTNVNDLPTNIGVGVAMGGYVEFNFTSSVVMSIANTRTMYPLDSDADWLAISSCEVDGGIFCLNPAPSFSITDLIPFTVVFKPSQQYYQRPTIVQLVWQSSTDSTVWTVVPEECLLGGVDIPQSPVQGIETIIA